MEDILKKVSHYQLFNYLLAGAVLMAALSKTTDIQLGSDDVILSFFLYYFVGMVISRIGSLVTEPVLKLLRVIQFRPYAEYLRALKLDSKLDTLSQENNTYRTLVTTFLIFIIIYLADRHAHSLITGENPAVVIVGAILLVVLFVFAYRKQTKYITKRIGDSLKSSSQSVAERPDLP